MRFTPYPSTAVVVALTTPSRQVAGDVSAERLCLGWLCGSYRQATGQAGGHPQPAEVVEHVEVVVQEGVGESDEAVGQIVRSDLPAGGRTHLLTHNDEVFQFGLCELVGWRARKAGSRAGDSVDFRRLIGELCAI